MNSFMHQNDPISNLPPFDETISFWGYEDGEQGSKPIGYDLGNNLIYDIAKRNLSEFSRIFYAIFFVNERKEGDVEGFHNATYLSWILN